jgi:hypothetical protein
MPEPTIGKTWTKTRRAAAVIALLLVSAPVRAAELYMFERDGCPYCAQFNREIAPGYDKSPEGQIAPLRRIDWKAPLPAGLALDKPIVATPTFVLVDGGKERARITGYPGADFFYWLLTGAFDQAHLQAPEGPGPAQ